MCGGAALELANMATLLLQPGGLYGRFMHYPQQQLTSTIHEPQQGKRSRDEGTKDSRMQAFISGVQQSAPSSSVTSQTVTGLPQSATASYGTVTTVPSPYLSLQQQQAGIVHPGMSAFHAVNRSSAQPSTSVSLPLITSTGFSPQPQFTPGVTDYDDLLQSAHTAYQSGEFSKALSLAHPYYLAYPGSTDVLLLIGAIYYQLRNYEQCIAFNDRCILLDPSMAEAHANMANALQQTGSLDMAIIYYQSALRLKPAFVDAYNNMASAFVQKGYIPQAMECYQAALRINPGLVDVHNNLGDLWRLQGLGGRQAAEVQYQAALALDKQYAPAWRGLGDLLRECMNFEQALGYYQEAARLRPNYADAYTGMAVCLKELRRLPEAEVAYKAVAKLRPNCALSLGNLAGIYYEQGNLQMAIQVYRDAIRVEPNFLEAYNNLGNALREAGCIDDAITCYTACIQLQFNPATLHSGPYAIQRLCVAYNNLSGILKMQGRVQESIQCYEQVSSLQPDSPEAHANLASAYKDAARHDVAITSYTRALQLRSDFPEAFANLIHSLQCVCDWNDRAKMFSRLEQEVRRDLAAGRLPPVQPFHAMAYPFTADLALAISCRYADHCARTAAKLGVPKLSHPPALPLRRGERLRVGYVSSDFGNHPLSHLMSSVFGMHDSSAVEVFCYALSPSDQSEWRVKIEREVPHFTDVSAWSVPAIAQRISADRIQVLINLNGYTKGARNEIFALKPAPVQASYMGFPATTGAEYLPYLITDGVVAPKHLHHCYSEHLALMPNCYFVNDYKQSNLDVLDDTPVPGCRREDIGLPSDKLVFSCSNQLYKYDPDTFTTWCNILKRVPNSVLWLLRFPPFGEPKIRAEAAARGVEPSRIIFTDVAAKNVHIRRSGLADVFLDTPLCNAHTTGCDVLWAGAPIVTLPLERMASRVAASLCAAAGFGDEMIVNSQEEYEERAVYLGLNHTYREDLRRRLKDSRLSNPLFDTKRWVRDFERVMFKMWDVHCEGRGPRGFEIEDDC